MMQIQELQGGEERDRVVVETIGRRGRFGDIGGIGESWLTEKVGRLTRDMQPKTKLNLK